MPRILPLLACTTLLLCYATVRCAITRRGNRVGRHGEASGIAGSEQQGGSGRSAQTGEGLISVVLLRRFG